MKSPWAKVIGQYIDEKCNNLERKIRKDNEYGQIEVLVKGQFRSVGSGTSGDIFIGEKVNLENEDFLIVYHEPTNNNERSINSNCPCSSSKTISYIPWENIREVKFYFPPRQF
jgi:hypothetical protein